MHSSLPPPVDFFLQSPWEEDEDDDPLLLDWRPPRARRAAPWGVPGGTSGVRLSVWPPGCSPLPGPVQWVHLWVSVWPGEVWTGQVTTHYHIYYIIIFWKNLVSGNHLTLLVTSILLRLIKSKETGSLIQEFLGQIYVWRAEGLLLEPRHVPVPGTTPGGKRCRGGAWRGEGR